MLIQSREPTATRAATARVGNRWITLAVARRHGSSVPHSGGLRVRRRASHRGRRAAGATAFGVWACLLVTSGPNARRSGAGFSFERSITAFARPGRSRRRHCVRYDRRGSAHGRAGTEDGHGCQGARPEVARHLSKSDHDGPVTAEAPVVRLATPSFRAVLRIVLIVVGCAIALYLLWRVRTVVRLAGISVFLALAILPVVDSLDRRSRVPRALIILAVLVVLITSVVVVGAVVVPSMVKEVGQLSHDAPRYARDLRANSTFRHYDNRYHISAKLVRDARRLPLSLIHI